jgi:hypothetical protein
MGAVRRPRRIPSAIFRPAPRDPLRRPKSMTERAMPSSNSPLNWWQSGQSMLTSWSRSISGPGGKVKRDMAFKWLWRAAALAALWTSGAGPSASAHEAASQLAQAAPRSFDSRPPSGPPTPAPRSSSGGTTVLPRVPYENRLDNSRRYTPGTRQRRTPDSQRVVPKPPAAGGDPAKFFDKPAQNKVSCEWLRRLATRTGRLYWTNRYERCVGID